jgi:hypothetical protein
MQLGTGQEQGADVVVQLALVPVDHALRLERHPVREGLHFDFGQRLAQVGEIPDDERLPLPHAH